MDNDFFLKVGLFICFEVNTGFYVEMACPKCCCLAQITTCFGACCYVSFCVLGLGWGTFLITMSITYDMIKEWKILTFICGLVVFIVSLIFLSWTLNECIKKCRCRYGRRSMDGNSSHINLQPEANRGDCRDLSVLERVGVSLNKRRDLRTNSCPEQSTHDMSFLPFRHNLLNNRESRFNNNHELKPINNSMVDISGGSINRNSHNRQATVRRTNCTSPKAIPRNNAAVKSSEDMPDLHTNMVFQPEFSRTEHSSQHHRDIENSDQTSINRLSRHGEKDKIFLSDLNISLDSNPDLHVYEDINSSYEEECAESEYEYVETLPPPPRRFQSAAAESATPIEADSCARLNMNIPARNFSCQQTQTEDLNESDRETDLRRFALNSDYETVREYLRKA